MQLIGAILQARMKSSRLPGKVLLPVLGRPILSFIIERIRKCQTVDRIVVAIPTSPDCEAIQKVCDAEGVEVFRGSENDVLARVYHCAERFKMDPVARFTADNPVIDPAVADLVIGFYLDHADEFDYVSNNHPPTWPDGCEVEVVRLSALKKAWQEATEPFQREHGTPYIWDQPELFRTGNVARSNGSLFQHMRWTLDRPEDYEFIRRIYEELYPHKPAFAMDDVLELLRHKPDIHRINSHLAGELWYRDHLRKLRTISPDILRKAN